MTLDPAFSHTRSLSWDEIHAVTRQLARRLQGKGPFDGIIAIARGGLVPAAILAIELNIRKVDTVCIAGYDESTRHDLEVLKRISGDGAGWLVVDDLVDTGRTAQVVRDMLPGGHYATLYAKPSGRPMVHTHVEDVEQETWLIFPWEAVEQI
ncbi:Xanthine-guanine phosphoribosyltransferase [Paramagnetospirillum magnetotacticum MS-1]|uniref:Xanthine-guanine phosphoribosyltransferase n=1 Tax=Paramagnetospirillum magnetotacticum MS-1 TaxID=272627 RepID=A0A0C2U925_PARME|nr:xanthine phosphoribosyltransferase [Paramagnetospirillum magnetotacticum]KIL97997.1 Xanthine-guanine phosphoribosyltransferase [Paramagnetospirillum magnetotacticum MS-1]